MGRDGRTDMARLIVAFRNFAYGPKHDMNVGAIQSYRVNIFDAAI
jgi:hypothetical protein